MEKLSNSNETIVAAVMMNEGELEGEKNAKL